MWKTWVQSLRWEDPLEKEMATHSSILAWRNPWREEPGRLLIGVGVIKSQTRLSDLTFTFTLAWLIKKKREKNQKTKNRNEKGEVTRDNAEIQRIIREYYEQLSSIKIDNLEEMGRFLQKFNLLRLNQEEIKIMNNQLQALK